MGKLSQIIRMSRRRAGEGELGVSRQLAEMAALRLLHGVGPLYYQMAGFWRRGLSWRDKTSQLSAREYRRRIDLLNPPTYRKLSQNKIPEKAILALFGIPTSRFLGRLQARVGCEPDGRPLKGAADLGRFVAARGHDRLVFKPVEGWGGKGVHIPGIEYGPAVGFREPGIDGLLNVEEYCTRVLELHKGTDWIVEEYFVQHPVVSALNPSSVNTIRIWVLDRADRGHEVLAAILRIGRAGMVVDNTSSGGIAAPIDLERGRLGPARDLLPEYNVYVDHPDHGARIEGVVLPFWGDVRQLAIRALAAFPGLRFAGLDVSIGPNGPVVQELNVSPDREHAVITGSPTAVLLKP